MKYLVGLIVALSVITGFAFYVLYMHPHKSSLYPDIKPYTAPLIKDGFWHMGRFNDSEFPVSFDEAKKLASNYLSKYAGINSSDLRIIKVVGTYDWIELKIGTINIDYNASKGIDVTIRIDADTGRLVELFLSEATYSSHCREALFTRDNATAFGYRILRDLGYPSGGDIGLKLNQIIYIPKIPGHKNNINMTILLFNLTVYGRQVY